MGLMLGMELSCSSADVVSGALERGLILISAGQNVVRVVPPLIIEKCHVDDCCGILGQVFGSLCAQG